MGQRNLCIGFFLIAILGLHPYLGFALQVNNVPDAFEALSSEPEVMFISNAIKVPSDGGHLQWVQVFEKNGTEKLLIWGVRSHKPTFCRLI